MKMFLVFSLNLICGLSLPAIALEGASEIEAQLLNKNLSYQAQRHSVEGQKAQATSAFSSYSPTLSAVGGVAQNRTDDLTATQKGYLGYLEGKLNLYRGSKDQAHIEQKKIDHALSEIEAEAQKRSLRLELTEVITDMIYLHELQNLLQEELKTTQTQRQMAAKKVAAGLTGAVDHLELDLRENEVEIEIQKINQAHSENHQKLKKLFSENIEDEALASIRMSPISRLTKIERPIVTDKSPALQKAILNSQKAELELQMVKADFKPTLDFSYSVGRLTPSEDSPTKFNESKYSLLLNWPLFSGFETLYQSKAAHSQIAAAQSQRAQTAADLSAEIQILADKIKTLGSLYEINERKLQNSKKYFELTNDEYRRGVKNSPDLVTATDRYYSTSRRQLEIKKELEVLNVQYENLF